jgi:hypothetical protein
MKLVKVSFLALALAFVASVSKADICIPGDSDFDAVSCVELGGQVGQSSNNGAGPSNPLGVPVDGGASLLILSGIGFGVKSLRNKFGKAKA